LLHVSNECYFGWWVVKRTEKEHEFTSVRDGDGYLRMCPMHGTKDHGKSACPDCGSFQKYSDLN
jgi:hypothetical protein